jgi:hypothetical protein
MLSQTVCTGGAVSRLFPPCFTPQLVDPSYEDSTTVCQLRAVPCSLCSYNCSPITGSFKSLSSPIVCPKSALPAAVLLETAARFWPRYLHRARRPQHQRRCASLIGLASSPWLRTALRIPPRSAGTAVPDPSTGATALLTARVHHRNFGATAGSTGSTAIMGSCPLKLLRRISCRSRFNAQ